MKKPIFFTLSAGAFILTLFLIASCTSQQNDGMDGTTTVPFLTYAIAQLMPLQDSGVSGTVTFTAQEGGVRVQATLTGLPQGKHGFHIHQYGDCTATDGTSAGGHFNPTDHPHSGSDSTDRHMGDLGNIESDGATASLDYLDTKIEMALILGRGVIVHAAEDDLISQPTGNAGGRLGCGVIGVKSQP